MKRLRRITALRVACVVSISLGAAVAARAADPATGPTTRAATRPGAVKIDRAPSMGNFLRFTGDGAKGGALETADVTYRNAAGATVRLVAAVHVGEEAYYDLLNRSFEKCDAVLYEMVKPKDAPAPLPGQHSDSGVAALQRFLKDTLNLSYQLDVIDYTPANFVHADLDAETFQQLQAERGESFATILLSSLMRSMTNPMQAKVYEDEPQEIIDLMTRPDGERQLKLMLARRMGDIEADAMGLGGLNGTVILTERNKAVLKALRQTLDHGATDVAIFYGAAHMPELAEGLEIMGFKPVKTRWLQAWDITIRPGAPSMFENVMKGLQALPQQR